MGNSGGALMRRDMDLVRRILLAAENKAAEEIGSSDFVDDLTNEATVAYHLQLMEEAGLIEANILSFERIGPVRGTVVRINWEGHDFLDAVRGEEVWRKTKDTVRKSGGSWTFDVMKAIATKLIMHAAGLG
jgi:hypothetical protein